MTVPQFDDQSDRWSVQFEPPQNRLRTQAEMRIYNDCVTYEDGIRYDLQYDFVIAWRHSGPFRLRSPYYLLGCDVAHVNPLVRRKSLKPKRRWLSKCTGNEQRRYLTSHFEKKMPVNKSLVSCSLRNKSSQQNAPFHRIFGIHHWVSGLDTLCLLLTLQSCLSPWRSIMTKVFQAGRSPLSSF